MKRAKYLHGADGKRSVIECYARMESVAQKWIRSIRKMDGGEDDLDQAICDFTLAYYNAGDKQDPSSLTTSYAEWRDEVGEKT
jgi:hypothetical protein